MWENLCWSWFCLSGFKKNSLVCCCWAFFFPFSACILLAGPVCPWMGFQAFLFEYWLWNGNLSVSHGRVWGWGGHPSITEMESDMSRRTGGLKGGDQSFFKQHDGLGWGEQGKKENVKKVKGGQEVDDGGAKMRYELKLRRMENEWGWEELERVQAPFHSEAQWRNPEGSADVELPQTSPTWFTWAELVLLCS